MTLYLLNHFSNVALVLLIVGGTTALAVVVTIVVHKLFPNLADSGFEEQTALSPDGVFRGWWCAEGSRTPPKDAGEIEWRLLRASDGGPKRLDGRWRYGSEQPWRGGWDLTKLDARSEPPDLAAMFDASSSFCRHP
jgi:hypothetical protein